MPTIRTSGQTVAMRPGESGVGTPKRQAILHIEDRRRALMPRFSQREAAAAAGLSRQYWEEVLQWARGDRRGKGPIDPSTQAIMAMATAVGCQHRVAQILGLIGPDEVEPDPLVIRLRDERELGMVQAVLRQLRGEDSASSSYGRLRAG